PHEGWPAPSFLVSCRCPAPSARARSARLLGGCVPRWLRRSAAALLAGSSTWRSGARREPVALAPQVREQRVLVLGALGLDLEDDLDLVDREVRPGADVLDVHDVAALARDREKEVGEHPGPVGEEG